MAGNSVKIRIDGDASDLEKKLKNIGNTAKAGLADVKAGIDLATTAMKNLASVAEKGIGYNASIEQLKTSFEVMTGSAEKAVETVERLRVMGAETPFEMKDLASTTQLLMQYGFTADEALDRMSMLGDVAQGNVQAMNSIALGYAQMSSAGKVNLVDIKQMINGGFNPLQEISERTGESMASLYDRISKGKISVDEITESMRHATSEGGRFYQSMEKQSQTLSGQLSTLKDNADQLLGSLTEGVSEGLRDQILPFANNLVAELQSAFDSGGYQGLVDTATDMIPDLMGMMTGELQKGIEGLSRWLPQGATQLMQALPSALRMASTVTPQLTQALFEVASSVITDLVSMLPELVPVVVEGFANTLGAALKGIDKLLTGLFAGVEQAFHQGQRKIAGVWVDDTNVAKYTFDIETDIEPAESAIESAYGDIRAALATDLLTPTQKGEIMNMIGDDYADVKAKLMSFGLSEAEAAPIASSITDAGKTIRSEIEKLDIGVDPGIVLGWMTQANSSRIQLKAAMIKSNLSPEDQSEIIGLFDSMVGNISGSLPNVIDEIFTTLTDGSMENDDPEALTKKLDAALKDDIDAVNKWLSDNIGGLDTESATYEQDVQTLTEQAATYKGEITTLHGEMVALVESLAGQPTAIVQARMGEFSAIESRLAEINAEIDATTEKVRSAAEAAFQVVSSGANADEATISQAISFKVSEFKLDEQAAEDAYIVARDKLNAMLAEGEITQSVYNASMRGLEVEKEMALQRAREAFSQAFGELMQGIAESEGSSEALNKAMQAVGAKLSVQDFYTNMFTDDGSIDASLLAPIKEQLAAILGDAFNPEQVDKLAESGDAEGLQNYLDTMVGAVEGLSADNLKTALGGKIGEAWTAALDEGILTDTEFDTTTLEGQLTALFSAMDISGAITASQGTVTEAAVGVANAASQEEKSVMDKGGESAGKWLDIGAARGIRNGASSVLNAAISVAKSVVSAFKNILGIASPSKVMMEIGQFTGEGYAIGLEKSMQNAVDTAKRMTGQVTTAASIKMRSEVVVPGMQVDMQHALENSTQPVNLYVNGRQLGKVMAADNQQAQNSYNRSIALGVGK